MFKVDTKAILRATDEVVQATWADYMNLFEKEGYLTKTELEELYAVYTNEQKYNFNYIRVFFGDAHLELFVHEACTYRHETLRKGSTVQLTQIDAYREKGTISIGREVYERTDHNFVPKDMGSGGIIATMVSATVTVKRSTIKFKGETVSTSPAETTLNIFVP